jgi:hypothetical protein
MPLADSSPRPSQTLGHFGLRGTSAVAGIFAMGTVTTSKGEQFRRWAAVRQRDGNDRCAECESRDTSWVVLNCAQPPLRPTLAMRVEEAV